MNPLNAAVEIVSAVRSMVVMIEEIRNDVAFMRNTLEYPMEVRMGRKQ